MVLTGVTVEVTNDGSQAVSNGPIYKTERDIDLNIEVDSTDTNPMSNTFAQQDVIFASKNKKVSFSFTTVLGKVDESTTISGGVIDMLKLANLTMVEGTAVGGKKVFDFTPNSNGEGKGELRIRRVDQTILIEKASASMGISVARGGETELKFEVTGYVKDIITGESNTLVDPVKPVASVLSTTDGINTGVTVDGHIVDPLNIDFSATLETDMPPVLIDTNKIVVIKGAKHTLKVKAYLSSGEFEEGFDALVNGSEIAVSVDFEDTQDAVIWSLQVPKAKVATTPGTNDESGVYAVEKEYLCRPTNGNDNFTLKYFSDITA